LLETYTRFYEIHELAYRSVVLNLIYNIVLMLFFTTCLGFLSYCISHYGILAWYGIINISFNILVPLSICICCIFVIRYCLLIIESAMNYYDETMILQEHKQEVSRLSQTEPKLCHQKANKIRERFELFKNNSLSLTKKISELVDLIDSYDDQINKDCVKHACKMLYGVLYPYKIDQQVWEEKKELEEGLCDSNSKLYLESLMEIKLELYNANLCQLDTASLIDKLNTLLTNLENDPDKSNINNAIAHAASDLKAKLENTQRLPDSVVETDYTLLTVLSLIFYACEKTEFPQIFEIQCTTLADGIEKLLFDQDTHKISDDPPIELSLLIKLIIRYCNRRYNPRRNIFLLIIELIAAIRHYPDYHDANLSNLQDLVDDIYKFGNRISNLVEDKIFKTKIKKMMFEIFVCKFSPLIPIFNEQRDAIVNYLRESGLLNDHNDPDHEFRNMLDRFIELLENQTDPNKFTINAILFEAISKSQSLMAKIFSQEITAQSYQNAYIAACRSHKKLWIKISHCYFAATKQVSDLKNFLKLKSQSYHEILIEQIQDASNQLVAQIQNFNELNFAKRIDELIMPYVQDQDETVIILSRELLIALSMQKILRPAHNEVQEITNDIILERYDYDFMRIDRYFQNLGCSMRLLSQQSKTNFDICINETHENECKIIIASNQI